MSEDIAKNILYRYAYMFYPSNSVWLNVCNYKWEPRTCSCIDEIEINIAILLYKIINDEDKHYKFIFRDYLENHCYPMKLLNKGVQFDNFKKCEFCKDFSVFKLMEDVFSKDFDGLAEGRKICLEEKEKAIIFVALCLFAIRTKKLNRLDIFKYLFLKDSRVFLLYLNEFYEFLNANVTKSNKDTYKTFISAHLEIIDSVLSIYANSEDTNILGDILLGLDNEFFKKNYSFTDSTINNFKKYYNETFVNFQRSQPEHLLLNTRNISIMKNIMVLLKNLDIQNLKIFESIFRNIEKILLVQKRNNEGQISEIMSNFNQELQKMRHLAE